MIAHASLRYLHASAQKTRLVADLIRGADVDEAMALLRTSRKRVARDLIKLLNSALANAQNREERVDIDRLFISRLCVDQGPMERRGRAGTMGRFMPRKRRRSHVRVELDVRPEGYRRRH